MHSMHFTTHVLQQVIVPMPSSSVLLTCRTAYMVNMYTGLSVKCEKNYPARR